MLKAPLEDIISDVAAAERKCEQRGFSFAQFYSFMSTAVLMAKGQERQDIIDALPKDKPEGLSAEQSDGYDKAMAAVVRILIERSIVV
jgi:hypothetical protein